MLFNFHIRITNSDYTLRIMHYELCINVGVPASRRAFRYIFSRSASSAQKGCRSNP